MEIILYDECASAVNGLWCVFWWKVVFMNGVCWWVVGILCLANDWVFSAQTLHAKEKATSTVSADTTQNTDEGSTDSESGSFWQDFLDVFSFSADSDDGVRNTEEDEQDLELAENEVEDDDAGEDKGRKSESDASQASQMSEYDRKTDANYSSMVETEVDKILSGGTGEQLLAHTHLVGVWLGESRYNGWGGAYYMYNIPDWGWIEGALGYGSSKIEWLSREFGYELKSRFYSAYSRFLYFPSLSHPLYLSAALGAHYGTHDFSDVDVFSLDRQDATDVDLQQFSGSLALGVGFFHIFSKQYYFSIDIFAFAFHRGFSHPKTELHSSLDDHLRSRWNRLTFLPPLNFSLGYLF